MWLNITSTHPNCVNFVRVLALGEIVEARINLCVGRRQSGQKGIEVGLVGTVCSVVAFIIREEMEQEAWLSRGIR